jgi:hypothetical protein
MILRNAKFMTLTGSKAQRQVPTLILTLVMPTIYLQIFSPVMDLTMTMMIFLMAFLNAEKISQVPIITKMDEGESLVEDLEVVSFQDHQCLITKIFLRAGSVLAH